MGSVFVYDRNTEDFSGIGLVGALTPKSCVFHEVANGERSVHLEHPIDDRGLYLTLTEHNILKVDAPVRTVPELDGAGQYVQHVERWRVKSGASKANRYLYNGQNPDNKKHQKKVKLLPVGAEIIITNQPALEDYRWKASYSYTEKKKKKTATGWIDHGTTTLELVTEDIEIPATSTGIEQVVPGWNVRDQLFRIYSVKKNDNMIEVDARDISYDLMYNLTAYDQAGTYTLEQAANGVLNGCFDPHGFAFATNITGTSTGFHYQNKDPITAFLDPDIGLVPRFHGELIRDNYSLTVLDHAGVNRGVMFTEGKNVKGIDITVDVSDVATAIRPVGETEGGGMLFLNQSYILDSSYTAHAISGDTRGIVFGTHHSIVNSEIVCDLPNARIFPMDGEDCKVGSKGANPSVAEVRSRLLTQAIEMLQGGVENPVASVSVDFVQLGETEQYPEYRDLEKVFLFDTVRVLIPKLRTMTEVAVSEIEWDCLRDRLDTARMGALNDLSASVTSWQLVSVNGAKLQSNSVDSKQLREDSVTFDALQANAITAEKISAAVAEAVRARVNQLTAAMVDAGHITANSLESALAAFEILKATSAELTEADIKTLYAEVGITDVQTVETLYAKHLRTNYLTANRAVIEQCVLKGDNGKYYAVQVGAGGYLQTTEVTITPEEEEQGLTEDGKTLIKNEQVMDRLSADEFTGLFAAINEITATTLTANEIFVTKLRASTISTKGGGRSLLFGTMADDFRDGMRLNRDDDNNHYLDVGDLDGYNIARIKKDGLEVIVDGGMTSKFGDRRQQLGHLIVYETDDGGAAFVYEE